MTLIPSDWEPLDHEVGPFGPEELQVRENPEKFLSARRWEVRPTARPDEVSVAKPPQNVNVLGVKDIKKAIAYRLNVLIPTNFDKDKGLLPAYFSF